MLTLILAIAAMVCAMLSATGKAPLWVAVVLLALIYLLTSVPLAR